VVKLLLLGCGLLLAAQVSRAETIPPKPENYFNDYAGRVYARTAAQFNRTLADYERESSNQLVVAVYPRMDSESSLQDYTYRVAESWQVGQAGRNNGAVLFVFVEDRTLFIQVGYGLEGVLPDVTAKRIIDDEIVPHLRRGDWERGLAAGIDAMIQATRGEYVGTGRTVGQVQAPDGEWFRNLFIIIIVALLSVTRGRRRRHIFSGRRHRGSGWWIGPGGGRGGFGGGGGLGGGGGGFSGGGGSFGGGGAGGRW